MTKKGGNIATETEKSWHLKQLRNGCKAAEDKRNGDHQCGSQR